MYPSKAPRNSNILTTALIGLFVGAGLAFLLDSQDGTIRTLTDLRQTLDRPILGIIPAFSKKLLSNREYGKIRRIDDDDEFHSLESELIPLSEVKAFSEAIHALYDRAAEEQQNGGGPLSAERHPVVIMSAPFSREAEAFRNLRTTILFSRSHATPKKILFTSAQKGVGKTTVAVNVAASISQTGVKVILIDADLRMPTVHEHFGLNRFRVGLSDYLEGNAELPEAIVESGISSLSLVLAGSPSQNPSELLSSPPMIELLGILEKQYDLVIIDTPPVGEIADALLLAHTVDGVIKVIRSGVSLKNSAKLTDTRLRQVNAKILGVAFNGVSNLSSFREGYEYYYSKYGSYGYHGYHSYHSQPGYHLPPPQAAKTSKGRNSADEDSLIM